MIITLTWLKRASGFVDTDSQAENFLFLKQTSSVAKEAQGLIPASFYSLNNTWTQKCSLRTRGWKRRQRQISEESSTFTWGCWKSSLGRVEEWGGRLSVWVTSLTVCVEHNWLSGTCCTFKRRFNHIITNAAKQHLETVKKQVLEIIR